MANMNTSHQRPSIEVAWVDQGIGEAGQHRSIKEFFETLSSLVTKWSYLDSVDSFRSYIENKSNVKLICVMSGGMSRLLVPNYSQLNTLHTIYVFCADIERARKAMENQVKVKGIFTVESELYEQMADDLSQILLDEGIQLAKLDERSLARVYYEEAKRLLNTQAKKLSADDVNTRTEEINVRLDQLLV